VATVAVCGLAAGTLLAAVAAVACGRAAFGLAADGLLAEAAAGAPLPACGDAIDTPGEASGSGSPPCARAGVMALSQSSAGSSASALPAANVQRIRAAKHPPPEA